jgi:hypothetical protein
MAQVGWWGALWAVALGAGLCHAAWADDAAGRAGPGLLFNYTAEHGFTADHARGQAEPIFKDKVKIIEGGAVGHGVEAANDQVLAWSAPGNIFAEQGTLAFNWRARDPLGRNQFAIFRVGYSDHTSWDMVFLRVDWNGHGFDAFVTDDNLARVRVSYEIPNVPKPDQWLHLAFSWDESKGVKLYVDGKLVAHKDTTAVLDDGLFAFGPHSRIISPMQVQTRYSYMRGGDIDEIAIFDRMLDDAAVTALSRHEFPALPPLARSLVDKATRAAWLMRYGFDRSAPPYLKSAATRIRKVEFTDARDIKELMWKGSDGIKETTWPGVYNRSRLPGRHDYFELPDWNVYAVGGKALTLTLPDEPWNRIEIQGAAFGTLTYIANGRETRIGVRPRGEERTTTALGSPLQGGKLRFDSKVQEMPIQEIAAYDVTPGEAPADRLTLSYTVKGAVAADNPSLGGLITYIAGRYMPDERAAVVALPDGAPARNLGARTDHALPLVHILIPADFRLQPPGQPLQMYSYGWENLNGGLDGVAIDLPALKLKPTHGGLIALNIRVMDPLWPDRALMDVNVSVRPKQARGLWLDTRDRILPNGRSLYITIASPSGEFGPASLDGMKIRLVFKDRAAAISEHVADRFMQVRDNAGFFIEEHTNSKELPLFARFAADITDLLRVDPDNYLARTYWAEWNPEQSWPDFDQPKPPADVPLWAFRQVVDLKLYQHFVDWWIDNRQIANGEFGGGLSDDTDLTNQWPGLALMGVEPEKINNSLLSMVEGIYANGMLTGGLGTIKTDELHSYEEGINGISQAMYLNYGNPEAIERLMATARNYDKLTAINSAGHRHVVTDYFSATDFVREGVWEWEKPPSHLVFHPGILLVNYNGNHAVKKLILELADGYLAHGKKQADGTYLYPFEINWRTDEDRGRGVERMGQIFWAAYRWTGEVKYLGPLYGEVRDRGLGALGDLNDDVIGRLVKTASWGRALTQAAQEGADNAFGLYEAWRVTGDKTFLERLYGNQIQRGSQRMYMMTDGEWWSDRVEYPSEELQRSRLGGVALMRNQITPGYLVSWSFAAPATAASVALLVSAPAPDKLTVEAFNLGDASITATMTPWDVAPGTWRMTQSVVTNRDRKAGPPSAAHEITVDRGRGLSLTLPPEQDMIFEFALEKAGLGAAQRPDIGIGPKDVTREKGRLVVRVHSLGALATPEATLTLEDAAGRVVASASVPALPAPLDLLPKTADVALAWPKGFPSAGARLHIRLAGASPEITLINNTLELAPAR